MKSIISILVLLASLHLVYSVEIVGPFLRVDGIRSAGFAVWNRTTESFVPQYHHESQFASANAVIHKPTGDVYFSDSTGINVWNKKTTMRVGGEFGYFHPANRISSIAVTSRRLYVCGTFQYIGPEHSRLNVTTGKGPQIVQFDITNSEHHLLFDQKYSLLQAYPDDNGVDCSSMLVVGDVLVVKDYFTNERRYLENDVWQSMNTASISIKASRLYVAEAEGAVYAIAKETNNLGDPYLIRKYSFQSKSWTTIVDNTHDTNNVAQIAIGKGSSEIYMAYQSSTAEDPIRNQKIFVWDGGSVQRVGKCKFTSDVAGTSPLLIQNTNMHYDTNMGALVIYSSSLNYITCGDEDQINIRRSEIYTRRVNKIVYYEPINDTFVQAYGGGFDTTPSAVINGDNNVTYIRGVNTAYNSFAPYIARLNPSTMKFEALFPHAQKIFDEDAYFGTNFVMNDFAIFNGGKSAYIAGRFRTLGNQTRNSVAIIHEDGTTEPLGQEPHVGVRNWGTSVEASLITRGVVSSMIYLEREESVYVAGEFLLAGNTTVSNIARYDIKSKTWHDLDGGVEGSINAMIYSPEFNAIFIGGILNRVGNNQNFERNIAKWNLKTQQWEILNDGLSGEVYAMVMYKGKLLVSGNFPHASGKRIHSRMAIWDGYQWNHVYNYKTQSEVDSNVCQSEKICSFSAVPEAFVEAHGYLYILDSNNDVYQYDGSQFKELQMTATAISRDYQGRLLLFNSGNVYVYNHKMDNVEFTNYRGYQSVTLTRTSGAAGLYANAVLIAMSLILFVLF